MSSSGKAQLAEAETPVLCGLQGSQGGLAWSAASPRCGCNDALRRCQPASPSHRQSLLAAPVPRAAPGLRVGLRVASKWPEETEATEAWGSAIEQKCISLGSDHRYPHNDSNQTDREE